VKKELKNYSASGFGSGRCGHWFFPGQRHPHGTKHPYARHHPLPHGQRWYRCVGGYRLLHGIYRKTDGTEIYRDPHRRCLHRVLESISKTPTLLCGRSFYQTGCSSCSAWEIFFLTLRIIGIASRIVSTSATACTVAMP